MLIHSTVIQSEDDNCAKKHCWDCIFSVQCRLLSDLSPKQMWSLGYLKSSLSQRVQHFAETPVTCILEIPVLKSWAGCHTLAVNTFYKEVVQHMCNPLWLTSHQCCLNHTLACTLSDWPREQESIKHHPSQARGSSYICFLSLHPWWKLKVNCMLSLTTHHSVACEHGALSEGEVFPPAGTQVVPWCQITPCTHDKAEHWSPPQALEGHC